MGQRARIPTQIAGVRGFKIIGYRWVGADGQLVVPVMGFDVPPSVLAVIAERGNLVISTGARPTGLLPRGWTSRPR